MLCIYPVAENQTSLCISVIDFNRPEKFKIYFPNICNIELSLIFSRCTMIVKQASFSLGHIKEYMWSFLCSESVVSRNNYDNNKRYGCLFWDFKVAPIA